MSRYAFICIYILRMTVAIFISTSTGLVSIHNKLLLNLKIKVVLGIDLSKTKTAIPLLGKF